ncbi:hypothetical protein DFP72DRAFT_852006 [Ephemerocybe angulata]|uniref:Uncharacterized protein n=1 Tax=Ephemerocybe angulata TaxID=980116 RepID=A0A8H6M3B3_9AGAR|nr:hypothetical protein DFP72DRAFT_852006 [Tulosesus angulatus]
MYRSGTAQSGHDARLALTYYVLSRREDIKSRSKVAKALYKCKRLDQWRGESSLSNELEIKYGPEFVLIVPRFYREYMLCTGRDSSVRNKLEPRKAGIPLRGLELRQRVDGYLGVYVRKRGAVDEPDEEGMGRGSISRGRDAPNKGRTEYGRSTPDQASGGAKRGRSLEGGHCDGKGEGRRWERQRYWHAQDQWTARWRDATVERMTEATGALISVGRRADNRSRMHHAGCACSRTPTITRNRTSRAFYSRHRSMTSCCGRGPMYLRRRESPIRRRNNARSPGARVPVRFGKLTVMATSDPVMLDGQNGVTNALKPQPIS